VNAWKVILATIIIFAAGAFSGAVLVRHAAPARFGPGGMRLEFLRRMERDLDLTPDQRQRVDKILKEAQEHTRKIMEPVAPAIHAELQRTKDEFRQILTPAQQVRFDELLRHSMRGREPHRPGIDHQVTHPSTNSSAPEIPQH
jgi:Spy/CpxP family protein refolding chaperone